MENGEDMEPGFAREVKKFASYAALIIGALSWLDSRYMGSHKELLTMIDKNHAEVLAMENNIIKLDKDIEYIRIDLDKLLAHENKPKSDRIPGSRSRGGVSLMYALPPNDKEKLKRKEEFIASN